MTERAGSRRRDRKQVLCRQDGELFDLTLRRPITVEELREHVRCGGLFEAHMKDSGRDATYEVLHRVVGDGLATVGPGPAGHPLAALAGGNRLEALGGLMRLLGPNAGRDEPTRQRRRRPAPVERDDDPPVGEEWGAQ